MISLRAICKSINCYQHDKYQNLVLFLPLSIRTSFITYRQISTLTELLTSLQSSRNLRHDSCMQSAPETIVHLNSSAEKYVKFHDDPPLKLPHSVIRTENVPGSSIPRRDYSLKQDIVEANCMITRLCEEGKICEARELFEVMPERNVVSWTALISGYMKGGLVEQARELFERVDAEKNGITWTVMISGFLKTQRVAEAEKLFNEMPDKDVVSWNTMLDGYMRNGKIEQALMLFKRMRERDIISWNSVISGLVSCGRVEEARGIFDQMPIRNVISWNILISGLARNGRIDEARMIFDRMPERNVVSWNSMIAGFIQNGELETARRLFDEMPEKNVVSWTAIISGYSQHGKSEEALRTFYMMNRSRRVSPNEVTFASVLGACSDLAGLVEGMQVHQVISKTVYHESKIVISALINMYSKCGVLIMARKVFDHGLRRCRDLVCWNSMVSAYAHHGCGREAIMVFEEMQSIGFKPDSVTYVGLLSACSHAGLVQEGLNYFEMLTRDKSIEVREEHYTCVVDLYSRAGRLEEAFVLIKQLPAKASIDTWRTLLLGCNIHGNDDIAKQVADRMLEVGIAKSGTYALLSNFYTACGKSTEAEMLKSRMKDEGVKKQPACSWIEVENKFHVFVVGDRSIHEHEAMRSSIFYLHGQMKKIGDIPFDNVLLAENFA